MHRKIEYPVSRLLILGALALLGAQTAFADRLVDDDALRALGRLAKSPACAVECKDGRWTLHRFAMRKGMVQAGDGVFLAVEDVQGSCGSAGCSGAYLLQEKDRLVLLGEGLGLGQGRRGLVPPGRIPNAAERAKLPSVSIKP